MKRSIADVATRLMQAQDTVTLLAPFSADDPAFDVDAAYRVPNLIVGGTTTLTFCLTNPNTATALTGLGFINVLTGLVVSTSNGLDGGCGEGIVRANEGSNTVSLTEATLAPGASCLFTVNVTAIEAGPLTDTTGPVTSNEGGSGSPSMAGVVVTGEPPNIIPTLQDAALPLLALLLALSACGMRNRARRR